VTKQMRNNTLEASVNYGDYKGTAAADRHDQRDLSDLAQKYGIDTERYFVFGVDVSIGETRGDKLAHTFVNILATDTQVVKAASVDFISEYVAEHQGHLPYVSLRIDASLEEVLLAFKRFNFVLSNRAIKGVREYEETYAE
jgi:hypothetical protein